MRAVLALSLLHITLLTWSQPTLHMSNHYAIKDGLSNTAVYCVRKDSRGFLWIGTKEGLNRFDGYQFKPYYAEKKSQNSLSHNKIFDILEYQKGMLLIATADGISVLNTYTGQFENERVGFIPLRAGSGILVCSMYQDNQENIWINYNGKIDVLDRDLEHLYCLTDLPWASSLKGITIYYEDWFMDQHHRLWLPTDTSGIQIVDFAKNSVFNKIHNPERLPYLQHNVVRSVLLDESSQTVWVCPWGEGLIKYHLATGVGTPVNLGFTTKEEQHSINNIAMTNYGTLLFTIDGRCLEMNPLSLEYTQVPVHRTSSHDDDTGIHAITITAAGDEYWIGAFEGLFQVSPHGTQRELALLSSTESADCVDLLHSVSGTIYSAYKNGFIIEVDSTLRMFNTYQVPLPKGVLLAEIAEDPEGKLWIGTTKGLLLMDPDLYEFQSPPNSLRTVGTKVINCLFIASDSTMWITTREPFGLFAFTPSSGIITKVENEIIRQFSQYSDNNRVTEIVEDKEGNLFMYSQLGGGILRFEAVAGRWSLLPSGSRYKNLLASQGIVSILPGDPDQLWLSTVFGDGLINYHYVSDSIIQYTREDGLLSDFVECITAGQSNSIWLTTEFGVTRFNSIDNNVKSNIFIDRWSYVGEPYFTLYDSHSNQLIFAQHDRHLFLTLDKDNISGQPPKPLLDRILVNNEEMIVDPESPIVCLNHKQKNLTVEFTATHYSNADNLRFAYLLQGANDEWSTSGATRTARYVSLSPGRYTFSVKVTDDNGIWGAPHNILEFTIIPPFWKSKWFLVSTSILLTFVIIQIFRTRIRTIRHEAGLTQQIVETEMMALRAQMNPHFIFNCINSIDALIQNDDKYHATIYLNKFAKLIRNVLDSSKQNMVTLEKDLETLRLYIELEQFRNENRFAAEISADPSLLQDDFKVPPLIIQPYVENAILHGLRNRMDNKGVLSISLSRINGSVRYIIEDNGVGRANTMSNNKGEKTSYGMQMSGDRIKLFNQEENASVLITDLVEMDKPSGTRVEVILKLI